MSVRCLTENFLFFVFFLSLLNASKSFPWTFLRGSCFYSDELTQLKNINDVKKIMNELHGWEGQGRKTEQGLGGHGYRLCH